MNFSSALRKIVLALCVLAVFSAQLFGMGSRFLCDCAGIQRVTLSDHCHGPHGVGCHEEAAPAHSGESCPDDADARTHSQIEKAFESRTAPAAELPLTPPVLAVLLTLEDAVRREGPPDRASGTAAEVRRIPPTGVAVARTVVLLI